MSEDKPLFTQHLTAFGKLNYARGERPNVECILCAIRDNNPIVESLKIYQEELLYISLNLYPYNPGHMMVVPTRHVEKFEDLTEIERNRFFEVTIAAQKLLAAVFQPTGFNVGYNQGDFSGASIKHIHIHIVPRYKTEIGFIEIVSKTKIIIDTVDTVLEKIRPRIPEFINPPNPIN